MAKNKSAIKCLTKQQTYLINSVLVYGEGDMGIYKKYSVSFIVKGGGVEVIIRMNICCLIPSYTVLRMDIIDFPHIYSFLLD